MVLRQQRELLRVLLAGMVWRRQQEPPGRE
jgi:hypothetical protein